MAESMPTAQKTSSPDLNDDVEAAEREVFQVHKPSSADQTNAAICCSEPTIVRATEGIPDERPQHRKLDASIEFTTNTVLGNNQSKSQNQTPSTLSTPNNNALSGITPPAILAGQMHTTLTTKQLQQVDTTTLTLEALDLVGTKTKKKQKKRQRKQKKQRKIKKQKKKELERDVVALALLPPRAVVSTARPAIPN